MTNSSDIVKDNLGKNNLGKDSMSNSGGPNGFVPTDEASVKNKEITNLKELNELCEQMSSQGAVSDNDIKSQIDAIIISKLSFFIKENYRDDNTNKLQVGDMNPILARVILSNIARFTPNIQNKLKEEFIKIDEYKNSFPSLLDPDDVKNETGDENESVDKELERKEKRAIDDYANKSGKLKALYDEYAREVVSRPIRNKLDQKDLDNARQDAMQDIAQNNIALEVNLAKIDQDRQYGLVAAFSDAKYSLLNQEIDDITSRIQLSKEAEKMLRDTNKESLQLHLKRNLKGFLNKEKKLEELELENKKHTKNIETLTEDIEDIKENHKANGMTTLKKIGLFLLSLTGFGLIFTLPYIAVHNLSRASELKKKIDPLDKKRDRMLKKKAENKTEIEVLTGELDNPVTHYQKNSAAVAQHNELDAVHSPKAKEQTTKLTRELELVTASISGKVSNIKNMDNNIQVMQSVALTANKDHSKDQKRKY